jgi:DUF1680 family protein
MKRKRILTILISIIAISSISITAFSFKTKDNNGSIPLPNKWKFYTGDNADFAKPAFNDVAWKEIKVDTFWERQGYDKYDGIAWYRIHVVLPSSLKETNQLLQAVQLSLGRIDDADETYVNGKKISATVGWDVDRSYLIPFALIEWDKENTIAIRVNDMGGNGGMYGGPHSAGDVKLSDVVFITTNHKPAAINVESTKVTDTLLFNFKIPVDSIEGNIKVKVFNQLTNEVVFEKTDNFIAGNKADSSYPVAVELKKPAAYKIDYSFTAKLLAGTINYNALFSYTNNTRQQQHKEYPVVKLAVADKSIPFDLESISFGGYLNERLNANLIKRLLNIDETGILECYYNRPGKQTWVGEYTGKYLHAASRVWNATKNEQLKTQMDRIVDILIACQNEDGYLGTYLPANYWTDWDVWAHKYNMLGLLSYYAVTGYKPALASSIKMGDLLCRTFGEGKEQRNIIESSGHVGMASTSVLEPMTYLYRYTGDKKYLDFCNYIIKAYDSPKGPQIITTLTTIGKVDKTANAKAYEMTSNLTGIIKLYQLTGDKTLLKAADNAWKDIATYKLYITGTASEHEYYRKDFDLPAGNDVNMGEGCVTTTWLQFCQALYNLTGEAKYMDEMEKTIYNHLFAAENPQTGCVSYYTALQGIKPYRCTIDAHCCLASIPRGIASIPELAFTKNATNGFTINLYSAGKFTEKIKSKDGKEVVVDCEVQTEFPANGIINIKVNPATKTSFRLVLRVPVWCNNFKVTVNGKILKGLPGTYLNIDEVWDKNSIIKVSFNLKTQVLDGGKSYPNSIAIKAGPQVLAIDQSLNSTIKNLDEIKIGNAVITSESKIALPAGWVGSQVFKTKARYKGKLIDLILVPFADAGQTGGEVRVWIKK